MNENGFILSRKFLKRAGYFLLGVGFFSNPWVIGKLLTEDGRIDSASVVYKMIVANGIFVICACFLIFQAGRIKHLSLDKRKVFAASTVFLTLAVIFFIFEGYLRFFTSYSSPNFTKLGDRIYSLKGLARPEHYTFDPVTGYAMIPNIHDQAQLITTDQYGFRTTGRKIDLNKESIIFVGDSTVFGWGVQDTSTFPYLIAQNEDLKEFNIINMGVPSYSIGHIVSVLKNKVPRFHPKIVFVSILWPYKPFDAYYSSPNAWKEIDFDFYRKTIPLRRTFVEQAPLWERLMPRSILFLEDQLSRFQLQKQIRENFTRPGIRDFSISVEDERKLALEHISLLKEVTEDLRRKGVKVVFYIHPFQYTVFHEDYRHLGKLGRDLMAQEFGALSLEDFLRKEFLGEPLFMDASHLTEAGHEKYAQYFDEQIKTGLKIQEAR